jgi:catechol 2,3-dioxygenase-like lactoylglutathione lyase family enzyme
MAVLSSDLREGNVTSAAANARALRPHLALTVSSVERSIPFYRALFGVEPVKVRPGYAKFEVTNPALNFTLNEGDRAGGLGAFNHGGIQVASTEDVHAASRRLTEAGLATVEEMNTTCCYARQDKIWVHDPDGTPWEVFAVLDGNAEDVERAASADQRCCA